MDFKLISKNNVGSAVLLFLVIALSQAKAFNFLIDSALGRFFLIIFVLCLSYCHKILGVVGVLFIVIMFNSNMYYEGFGNNSTDSTSTDSTSTDASSTDASSNSTSLNKDQIKEMIKQQLSANDASNNSTTTNTTTDTTTNTTKSKNSKAAEGFDILGIENSIKRGKQSNSIPVNSFMRDADSIAPYEGTSFLGSFSPF
jgi:hypothetical protein